MLTVLFLLQSQFHFSFVQMVATDYIASLYLVCDH